MNLASQPFSIISDQFNVQPGGRGHFGINATIAREIILMCYGGSDFEYLVILINISCACAPAALFLYFTLELVLE